MEDIIATELKRIIHEAIRDALSELPPPVVFPTLVRQPAPTEDLPPIMSPAQLAKVLDVSVRTLERWRVANEGPAFQHPVGTRFYRYLREDVLDWLTNNSVDSSQDPASMIAWNHDGQPR